jgi:hypothetical protein
LRRIALWQEHDQPRGPGADAGDAYKKRGPPIPSSAAPFARP